MSRRRKHQGVESPIERILLRAMQDYGMVPTPQYPILQYFADFAFPEEKLVVECDGHQYHHTARQKLRDLLRERRIRRAGWRVIRFTGSQIYKDATGCAKTIRRTLRSSR